MNEFASIGEFTARVKVLGPQWVSIGGRQYQCHSLIRDTDRWFIATSPHDFRVFRVNPFIGRAEAVLLPDPPQGELLPSGRHLSLDTILQMLTEAVLFDPMQGQADHYAGYLVTVLAVGQLIHPDTFALALLDELVLRQHPTEGLRAYLSDTASSPRLRAAWADALVVLALQRAEHYRAAL